MSLTPEQKTTVATWVAAGDNLSAVQKKLLEHFKITLTYRDVRFLVDDLELTLKDPAPKADVSDVSKSAPAPKPAAAPAAAGPTDLPPDDGSEFPEGEESDLPPEDAADLPPADPAGPSTVTVVVDKVTLILHRDQPTWLPPLARRRPSLHERARSGHAIPRFLNRSVD